MIQLEFGEQAGGGQDRDGRGNLQGLNCPAEVTVFVLWEGKSLSWGWGQRAAFKQMNWKPSPSFVLGWLPSLTYPLASPQTPQGELVGNSDGMLDPGKAGPREQILWLGESPVLKEAESVS